MRVNVEYMTQVRRAAGRSEETFDWPGGSLAELVRFIAGKHPDAASLLFDPAGLPSRSVLIFVNDEPATVDVPIADGSRVSLMTPMAGGSGMEPKLSDEERATFEWQMWTPNFGAAGQEKLKAATVLVSRVGGVGGSLAQQLAAAGVGKLILAHAGNSRANDLNRQILMSHARLGEPRVEQAADKLRELNPRIQIEIVPQNITADNARDFIAKADLVASCAPLFSERLAMNDAAAALGKTLVDCAMFDMELQVLSVVPGGPCLRCLYPEPPAAWKREFPVFGAVAGAAGCLGAVEVIKLLANLGEPLADRMLLADLSTMSFRKLPRQRDPRCPACGDAKSRLNS